MAEPVGRARRTLSRAPLALVVVVGLPLLVLLGAGPTPPALDAARLSTTAGAPGGHEVLALGDSVPSGYACDCAPFPVTYGARLGARTGSQVTVDNEAVDGSDTADLIDELGTLALQEAVRRSDIVLLTIGANDFGDHLDDVVDGACTAAEGDCVADELATLGRNLDTVLDTIRSLRAGRPTTVLVTGYWNVFEDGEVGLDAYGAAGLDNARTLTRRANAVISDAVTAAGAQYVDLFGPFQDAGRDITSLIADDGDHPDAAGHDVIAGALLAAGTPRLG
ncbi:SGNH/GDSL hydrolase family protein [Pimelobacter simplex]|uniref:SGNH/GDSL hydrolase family protein n=1 Tax=Nocardioides simplex TaxID=2045 RepID=UPI0021505A11|nr:SGNH/GDSL hydrolase family protein [Pimelobacter simplex]UUW89381.1 SGNH/GDSL hydrolase family protein [Pimelobacter simplex]UUW93209.1 SGNH/GDSL hydrolase family protein [Pimelobacter simplex]